MPLTIASLRDVADTDALGVCRLRPLQFVQPCNGTRAVSPRVVLEHRW